MRKLLKIVGAVMALLLVALLLAPLTGKQVMLAGGQVIGYSRPTGEWLFNQYPNMPVRRDGPYVLIEGDRRIALTLEPGADAKPQVRRTPVTSQVEVVVDNDAGTRFTVPLRDQHPRPALRWPAPTRLLAASDLEGEFDAATRLLRAHGVIDERLHWRYGDGHLVLIGDMVDRGNHVVPLLWLLYKLDGEARRAGGAVHYVLGNHEQYLLQGRPKAAHPKHLGTARVTGMMYGALWSEQTELGRWLRSKPMLIQVGDTLFVHGGVSAPVLALGLDLAAIDALSARFAGAPRRSLDPKARTVLQSRDGLSSYRGLAGSEGPSPNGATHVHRVLAHFGAQRIAIGHSLAAHVGHTHGGRVLRTGVAHAAGVNEAILWSDGRLWRVNDEGVRVPLAPATDLVR